MGCYDLKEQEEECIEILVAFINQFIDRFQPNDPIYFNKNKGKLYQAENKVNVSSTLRSTNKYDKETLKKLDEIKKDPDWEAFWPINLTGTFSKWIEETELNSSTKRINLEGEYLESWNDYKQKTARQKAKEIIQKYGQ